MMRRLYPIAFLMFAGLALVAISLSFIETEHKAPHSFVMDPQKEQPIIEWAQNRLSHKGILTEHPDGYVYLKVDDNYIHQLFPMLSNPNYTKPPYFRRKDSPGAHVSVIYADERGQTGAISEIGQTFLFTLKNLAVVPEKTQRWIVLQIESPSLEALRQKYGLSPLLKGHAFHITIAEKKHHPARHRNER